ncbi:MAG TPA: tRNA pseudouridine(38-40) synthase TruA [Vicinamibacteria bacterium]|nr:tRNA pseudouridine(38-40) synthase TruA [Vicinamibacteria bacterium]
MHVRVTLAYDGTGFRGFQSQLEGARTVQGELEAALGRLSGGARVAVQGAGRTDAGVHAVGQVACFDLPRAMTPAALTRALNALLPRDVRVLEAAEAPAGFHARRSARSKFYRYVLDTGPVQLPTRRPFAAHVPAALDRRAVAETAELFVGRHDFASLASAGASVKTTTRTVFRAEVIWESVAPATDTLVFETEADGYLRKMVRSMVGGLVAAGRGVLSVAELKRALDARDRGAWPAPAAARGLTLVRVDYDPVIR